MPRRNDLLSNIQQDLSSDKPVDNTAADAEASAADQDADKAIKIEELRLKREHIEHLKQNRDERKKYAHHIFLFTCIWASVIFIIVLLAGFKKITGFDLSDKVLITLITSTTVNFFGFFLLVVKYLFHTGEIIKVKKEKDSSKIPKKKIKDVDE